MKFSIKDFFSKCDQIRSFLVTFTEEEILNGKLHFLCSVHQTLFRGKSIETIFRECSLPYSLMKGEVESTINPLMPGGNKKVTYT